MKTFRYLIALAAGVFLLTSTQPVFAQQGSSSEQQDFCNRIVSVEESTLAGMQTKRQVQVKLNPPTAPVKKLVLARSEADKLRAKHLSLIIEKLNDPVYKQAVESYRDTLTQAINTRRSTTDSAQNDFNSKLVALLDKHSQTVSQAEEELMGEVKKSFDNARSLCAEDQSNQTVKPLLSGGLKNAKMNFANRKQSLTQSKAEYRRLVQERNNAITRAIDQYNKSEQQARQELLLVIKIDR